MSIIKAVNTIILLVALVLVLEISSSRSNMMFGKYIEDTPIGIMRSDHEKLHRQLRSMVDAYGDDGELNLGMNDFNTKYKTWKRNADLINSLLALPMEMNEAGR